MLPTPVPKNATIPIAISTADQLHQLHQLHPDSHTFGPSCALSPLPPPLPPLLPPPLPPLPPRWCTDPMFAVPLLALDNGIGLYSI